MDPAEWADRVLPDGSYVYIDLPGLPGTFCDKRRLASLLAETARFARIPPHARLTPFRYERAPRTRRACGGIWRRSPDLRALVYLAPAGERARWWLEGVAPIPE